MTVEPGWLNPAFRTNLIEGDSPLRHSTLLDILIARREHVLHDPPSQLRSALSSIFAGEPSRVGTTYELISDSLALIEPTWHAAIVGDDYITPLASETAHKFAVGVAANRQRARNALQYPTHGAIGELLTEPHLFAVRARPGEATEVRVWIGDDWIPLLETTEGQLPLKQGLANNGGTHERLSRHELLAQMDESFCALSESVLWPVFLPDQENDERISIVLIHASSWRVAGVWALHSFRRADRQAEHALGNEQAEQYERVLATPPQHVFNDLLGAVVDQPHTHGERLDLVKLCRRARNAGELNLEHERAGPERDIDLFVYNRLGTDDRVAHLQAAYEIARRYLLEGSGFNLPSSLGELLSLSALRRSDLDDLCRACFLSQELISRAPWTAQLALAEAVLLSERVLSAFRSDGLDPAWLEECWLWLETEFAQVREAPGAVAKIERAIACCKAIATCATLSAPSRESAASLAVLLNVAPPRSPAPYTIEEPACWRDLPQISRTQLRNALHALEEQRG